MPTYSYVCHHCHQETEAFQKITDDPLVHCAHCKKDALVRGIGGGSATFQFQGKGFYINDYKKSSDTCCPCGKKEKKCSQE